MVQIRNGTFEDAPLIVDFNCRLAYETEGIELDKETVKAGVHALLSDSSKGWYYIAEDNGVPVGQTLITLEWSEWRNGYWWWIQSVYIKPEWRRKGVFKQLYNHVKNEAKHAGNTAGIRLYVDQQNNNAQKTYEALGMNRSHYQFFEWTDKP